jgi:hypothetical protein
MKHGLRVDAGIPGMDHIDPPVRTNHSEFVIGIAYGVAAGGERDESR